VRDGLPAHQKNRIGPVRVIHTKSERKQSTAKRDGNANDGTLERVAAGDGEVGLGRTEFQTAWMLPQGGVAGLPALLAEGLFALKPARCITYPMDSTYRQYLFCCWLSMALARIRSGTAAAIRRRASGQVLDWIASRKVRTLAPELGLLLPGIWGRP